LYVSKVETVKMVIKNIDYKFNEVLIKVIPNEFYL